MCLPTAYVYLFGTQKWLLWAIKTYSLYYIVIWKVEEEHYHPTTDIYLSFCNQVEDIVEIIFVANKVEVTSENKCWCWAKRVVWKDLEIKLDLILKSFWRLSIKDEKSWKRCPLSWKTLKIDPKRRPPPLWDTTLKRKQRLYHKCNQKCRNVTNIHD